MMDRIALPLSGFEKLLLAAMTLSAAGLKHEPEIASVYSSRMEIDVPLDPGRQAIVLGGWISGHELVDILCNQVTLIVPAEMQRHGARPTRSLGYRRLILKLETPSAHETIAATTLLEDTLTRIGVATADIANLLELRR